MSDDPGIRDAVRQLSRAVGTLVRALAGSVGRKHPAVAGPADTGPPQAWLDLVAETDPDWLARSPWAARVPGSRRRSRRSSVPTQVTRSGRDQEPYVAEPLDAESFEHRSRSARTSDRVVPDEARTTESPRQVEHPSRRQQPPSESSADRQHSVGPQLRRLLPADSHDEVATQADEHQPRPVQRTAPHQARSENPAQRWDDQDGHAAAGPSRSPIDWPAWPVQDAVREGRDPGSRTVESPSHRVEASKQARLPASRGPAGTDPVQTMHERPRLVIQHDALPGNENDVRRPSRPQTPSPESRVPPSPRPSAAAGPVWPELPSTENLEGAGGQAALGLAALIWRSDGAADTLITAQRRS